MVLSRDIHWLTGFLNVQVMQSDTKQRLAEWSNKTKQDCTLLFYNILYVTAEKVTEWTKTSIA